MNFAAQWDAEHQNRLMAGPMPLQPVFDYFLLRKRCRVLDIGCGAGTNSQWLATQGYSVTAFDSSAAAIDRAKIRRDHADLRARLLYDVHDATQAFPYPSKQFDIALDVRALENLDSAEALFAMREIARVLNDGGHFVSLTASNERADKLTTVGKCRKMNAAEACEFMQLAGFGKSAVTHYCLAGVDDLWIVATKGIFT